MTNEAVCWTESTLKTAVIWCSAFLLWYISTVVDVVSRVLLQSWNKHFFVLTLSHLYYTEEQEEQEQDANDDDCVSLDDKQV